MQRLPQRASRQNLRSLVLLACCLIAATALAALTVMVIAAKAQRAPAASRVCPPDDRSQLTTGQIRTGARRALVPPGASELIVCRYNGMNASGGAPQWGLRGVGVTADRARIRRITTALDALRPPHGVYSCPSSDASYDMATFDYGSPPRVVLRMDTGDCNTITNGRVHRLGLAQPVVAQIESLTEPVSGIRWANVRGHLRLCGGPAPGHCQIENFGSSDRVVVSGSNGLWVAMADVHHGRFAFQVAASGTYTFALYAGSTLVKKLRRSVTGGKTTNVVLLIPIP